jgi:hypothetical protein
MTNHTPGCIDWPGAVDDDGDGRVNQAGRWAMAHRVAWERERGPIAAGLSIDHLCRNRRCVNTAHMEPVTSRENTLRGTGPTAENARKEYCWAGHPLAGSNLRRRPTGQRECKECSRARWRAYRRRQLAAGTWSYR